ncbi:MAG: 2-C-methyl-D-erythritol 4-phosphate cytidylyltransferase, partial [archaeon]
MNTAIIVGAGKGERMQSKVNKILLSLEEKPLIYHTIKVFEDSDSIDKVILVINKDDEQEIKNLIKKYNLKIKNIVFGGEKRQDSVYNGIKAIENGDNDDIIVIHNAANPFVDNETVKNIIEEAKKHGAAVAALKSVDTLKEVNEENFVSKTLDRNKIWRMQTPQAMKYDLAVKAFDQAYKDNFYATDDVALIERLGEKVKIVETNKENIKITTPEDLVAAEKIIKGARVGLGLDSHRFETEKEKPLILGGIEIPNEPGLKANSDGDVILHALFNALSQAIGGKSIGCYADKICLQDGITDSKEYLEVILKKLEEKNYRINNIGMMIEAKKPNLGPHHDKIKESLSELLKINKENIGLTFTSGEDLTDFGKGLGMQC